MHGFGLISNGGATFYIGICLCVTALLVLQLLECNILNDIFGFKNHESVLYNVAASFMLTLFCVHWMRGILCSLLASLRGYHLFSVEAKIWHLYLYVLVLLIVISDIASIAPHTSSQNTFSQLKDVVSGPT